MATKPDDHSPVEGGTNQTAAKPRGPKAPASTRVKQKPPAGPPKEPKTTSEAALREAFAKPVRTVLTRDMFLRSSGARVVEVDLQHLGCAVLMRRVILLSLIREGGEHWPLKGRLLSIIERGGVKTDMLKGDQVEETLALANAVAKSTIVVPPSQFVEVVGHEFADQAETQEARKAALLAVREDDLRPLFVDEDPDEDQIQLEEGGLVPLHPEDLVTILSAAHAFGPGALGRRFRGEQGVQAGALGALQDLARRLAETKRAS